MTCHITCFIIKSKYTWKSDCHWIARNKFCSFVFILTTDVVITCAFVHKSGPANSSTAAYVFSILAFWKSESFPYTEGEYAQKAQE